MATLKTPVNFETEQVSHNISASRIVQLGIFIYLKVTIICRYIQFFAVLEFCVFYWY